jgi:hypothetical protein
MKPKPLVGLNHFTVPVGIVTSPQDKIDETPRTIALPDERSQCREGNLATSEADKHNRNFDVATLVELYTSPAATQLFRKFRLSTLFF